MSGDAKRFFDAIAGRYEREYAPSAAESRERMARVLRELPPAPGRILDLGVGTGRELTTLLDAGYEVTGVDVSPAMLGRCARRARPVPLVEADFWAPLPLDDGSFDAGVALHGTLAHPPDDGALPALTKELRRLLRPGGVFVLEVPSPSWLDAVGTGGSVARTGPATGTHRDAATGATIATRLLSADEWTAAFGPAWSTRVEALGPGEWLVVAHAAR